MDTNCKFSQEYLPVASGPDPVAEIHLENCPDCREAAPHL